MTWSSSLRDDVADVFAALVGCFDAASFDDVRECRHADRGDRLEQLRERESTDAEFAEKCKASRRESQRKRKARDPERVKAQARKAYLRWKARRAAA